MFLEIKKLSQIIQLNIKIHLPSNLSSEIEYQNINLSEIILKNQRNYKLNKDSNSI
jgi:hypothetical protein